MPEGHSIRHFANVHSRFFEGTKVETTSPQGRFSTEASIIDGSTFLTPSTHGKHLFFRFDEHTVHVHLGLYGWFTLKKERSPQTRDTIRLRIQNDACTSDLSAPTSCELISSDKMKSITSRLGPDPLHADADPEKAWDKISRSRKTIGGLLMDQSVIAGIGNVYRAEILHRCELDPYKPGLELTKEKFEEVWNDAVYLLKIGSTSGRIYTVPPELLTEDEKGIKGHAQSTYVYKRTGSACRICTSQIREATLDGRTLYWCPTCQK